MGAAVRGSGLALLPHLLVKGAIARGELQPVLSNWPSPPLPLFLAYTSRRNQHLRVRKLIDHLIETLPSVLEIDRSAGQEMASARVDRVSDVAEA
ncbi:hypothetical protein GEOBC_00263 [Geobacteraceae bacterium]|nr:hypothetical protein GEOBC_00263 [Geobacteraceae bacterium]